MDTVDTDTCRRVLPLVLFYRREVHAAYRTLTESRRSEDQEFVAMLPGVRYDRTECFCGTQLPKRLIPREYHKRSDPIDALWKFDMSGGWRLTHAVSGRDCRVRAIAIEWFDHGEYERLQHRTLGTPGSDVSHFDDSGFYSLKGLEWDIISDKIPTS